MKPSAPDWLFQNIAEAAKNAQQVFLLLVSLLVYFAVSIVSTSDRQVVLNSTIQLPILNSSVSLEAFFVIGPALSLLLFVYLQLHVQKLQGLVRQLRHDFAPTEARRLYPSVLTIADAPEPGSVGKIQTYATTVSLWWLLPFVMLLFAMWSVRKHSLWLSYWVCAYPLLAVAFVVFFWSKYKRMRSSDSGVVALLFLIATTIFCDVAIAAYVIPAANIGRFAPWSPTASADVSGQSQWGTLLRKITCADLSYEILVTEQKKEYDTYWVNLEGAHLEGANLDHTILKLANLRGAHLDGALLTSTTLRAAMLEGADFANASLKGVDLSYAKLTGANHLSISQLCQARTLFSARVDLQVAAAITAKCPRILEQSSQDW